MSTILDSPAVAHCCQRARFRWGGASLFRSGWERACSSVPALALGRLRTTSSDLPMHGAHGCSRARSRS